MGHSRIWGSFISSGFKAAALAVCLLICACIPRREAPAPEAAQPQGTQISPEVLAVLNAVLGAAKRLRPEELANLVADDYNDTLGRNREQLLEDFRRDQERLLSADVTARNPYSQQEEGSVLLRFEFSWRGIPREGPELKVEGRTEWTLRGEGGNLKLSAVREDNFLGITEPK